MQQYAYNSSQNEHIYSFYSVMLTGDSTHSHRQPNPHRLFIHHTDKPYSQLLGQVNQSGHIDKPHRQTTQSATTASHSNKPCKYFRIKRSLIRFSTTFYVYAGANVHPSMSVNTANHSDKHTRYKHVIHTVHKGRQ